MRNKVVIVYIATVAAATVLMKEFYHSAEYERLKDIRFASGQNVKKCDLSEDCPLSHYAIWIKSGAANAVGPTICFDGDIIMSHGLRNVGPGLNIVQVHGNNGTIKRFDCLHAYYGNSLAQILPGDTLTDMMELVPGTIVLVASFDDVSTMMAEEAKDIFVGLGSTLVKRVKYRDSWVFAGRTGMTSPFEELTPNDEKTNKYGDWPAMSEVSGCFPRKL